MLEKDIQIWLVDYLRTIGIEVHGNTNEATYKRGDLRKMGVMNGKPDLEIYGVWRVAFIELKLKRGRMSDSQKRFQSMCETYKIPHIVIYADTYEEAKQEVDQFIARIRLQSSDR